MLENTRTCGVLFKASERTVCIGEWRQCRDRLVAVCAVVNIVYRMIQGLELDFKRLFYPHC